MSMEKSLEDVRREIDAIDDSIDDLIIRRTELVERVRPNQVTLVPDDIRQATSDHGWDIGHHRDFLSDIIARLRDGGMRVSVFVDPEPNAATLAREVGADRIEIYTGPYGGALDPDIQRQEFDHVVATGRAAANEGIGLNAGHDLPSTICRRWSPPCRISWKFRSDTA